MPQPGPESDFEREEEQAAAAEAAAIGGRVSNVPPMEDDPAADPAMRPLSEAGEGESEGFELAEAELEDHASHGDMHSAGRILEDAGGFDEDARATGGGEADEEIKEDS